MVNCQGQYQVIVLTHVGGNIQQGGLQVVFEESSIYIYFI